MIMIGIIYYIPPTAAASRWPLLAAGIPDRIYEYIPILDIPIYHALAPYILTWYGRYVPLRLGWDGSAGLPFFSMEVVGLVAHVASVGSRLLVGGGTRPTRASRHGLSGSVEGGRKDIYSGKKNCFEEPTIDSGTDWRRRCVATKL